MNILLIGHICIDNNVSENTSYTSWGSALMYMGTYYKIHTAEKITLIAPYGQDFLQYSAGFNILNTVQGEHTLVYKNISGNGKRTQSCEGTEYAKPVNLNAALISQIAQADIIILAPLLPNYSVDYVDALLANKKENCLTALLPQGYFRDIDGDGRVLTRNFKEAPDLLPLFDMMILSEDDMTGGVSLLQTWAALSPRTNIIMTQSNNGASWITEKEIVQVPTTPVPENKIVDTVGCGDTFSAAAIYNYFKSRDIKGAISTGNKAANVKLQHKHPV